MKAILSRASIRTRLLIVQVSIILVGFAGLTLIAGRQISSAAQVDFAQRLQNEVILIAQGIGPVVDRYIDKQIDSRELNTAIANYETQVNAELRLYPMHNSSPPFSRNAFHNLPELENASRGQVALVERRDETGEDTFYTAAPVLHDELLLGLIQLSVPARNLQMVVAERWLELGSVFILMTAVAVLAVSWLSRSIIQPLHRLRESAIRLSEGHFEHRVAYSGQDEIGAVAQAFNEMARQVESMLEEQRAFASNTSHELRTPLTTIRLRSEALRYDQQLDAAIARRYIAEIDDEVSRMSALIEDLTLLSRFDAGRAELGDNQIDLSRFAASLQQRMLPQASAKNIRLELDLAQDVPPVCAGLNHFTVVFRNLLDNAVKYTPEGGSISWRISAGVDGICSVMEDTGRGIEPDQLPHLFERFYRADKARSRDIPGTGLGLAIAKSIVEAYGGSISVESQGSGKGTIVRVLWPYRPGPVE